MVAKSTATRSRVRPRISPRRIPAPAASVTKSEAATYENLVELDLYLLNREVSLYEHSFSSKTQVDAKLAQLSRDMEDAPETHHETAQSSPMDTKR